jgi:DNA-binding NarL/FixJ family response regulator
MVGRDRESAAMISGRPHLRLLVADDQTGVREGLALMLGLLPEIEVVGTAADGFETLEQAERHHPDAVLLDLHMPRMDGTEATRRLSAQHPEIAVVILTTFADDATVREAMAAGARAFLTKDAERGHIVRTLHSAVAGLTVLDPQVQALLLTGPGPRPAAPVALPDGLTPRELDVLRLLVAGRTNQEIAAGLYVSGNTVKTHISRIFAKTGSRDRVAAVRYAQQHGLARTGTIARTTPRGGSGRRLRQSSSSRSRRSVRLGSW